MLDLAQLYRSISSLHGFHHFCVSVPDEQSGKRARLFGEYHLVVYRNKNRDSSLVRDFKVLFAVCRREVDQAAPSGRVDIAFRYHEMNRSLGRKLLQTRDHVEEGVQVVPAVKFRPLYRLFDRILLDPELLHEVLHPVASYHPALAGRSETHKGIVGFRIDTHHCVGDYGKRHGGPDHKKNIFVVQLHLVVKGRVFHSLVALVYFSVAERCLA